MSGSRPKVGAFVLETLTTGMYTQPLDTLREFVQNAADSIWKGRQRGTLSGKGRIEVELSPEHRSLVVRDDGVGLEDEVAADKLLNIGMSDKEFAEDAGFRGIGRLAGMAYCKKLRFSTTAHGHKASTTVEFDCEGIRTEISPHQRKADELADVLERHSNVSHAKCKPGDHFFEVSMLGIGRQFDVFLDWEFLERYLSQVAPVDFEPGRFMWARKVHD